MNLGMNHAATWRLANEPPPPKPRRGGTTTTLTRRASEGAGRRVATSAWVRGRAASLLLAGVVAGLCVAGVLGSSRARAEEPAADFTISGVCLLWVDSGKGDPRQPFDKIPQPKTTVTLYAVRDPLEEPTKIAETTTDEQGRFKFTGLEPPRTERHFDRLAYGFVAKAPGHPLTVFPYFVKNKDLHPFHLPINDKSFRLLGKVVDAAGRPVAGARVHYDDLYGCLVPGVHNAVSDRAGHFRIDDLPVPPAMFREDGIGFRITHPDYPVALAKIASPDEGAVFTLAPGCTLTGTVVDGVSGQPAAGAIVAAENGRSSANDRLTRTDAAGRYRLTVAEGSYNVVAELPDRAGAAATDLNCLPGQTLEVPPLRVAAGGWIEGRLLNAKTNVPIPQLGSGTPNAIGLFGPGHPARPGHHLSTPLDLAQIDGQGHFRLRAAAGDNFPYLLNLSGRRMAWDTLEQPAVVVKEGETTHYDMLVDLEPADDEKK